MRIWFLLSAVLLSLGVFSACSSEKAPSTSDEGSDASDGGESAPGDDDDDDSDAAACGPIVTGAGETCVGFGAGEPCDSACGAYGYVCFDGAPPGFDDCRKVRDTAAGQTYCCAHNGCVAQPDQDSMCSGSATRPHRFQCPPDGNGGNAKPPAGCKETGSGSTEVEKFYCCP